MRTNFLGLVLFLSALLCAFPSEFFDEKTSKLVSDFFWILPTIFGLIFMAEGFATAVRENRLKLKIKRLEANLAEKTGDT